MLHAFQKTIKIYMKERDHFRDRSVQVKFVLEGATKAQRESR